MAIKSSRSYEVRTRLRHPVVDADGHILEMAPVLMDYVRQVGGHEMVDRVRSRPQWSPDLPREGLGHPRWTTGWWGCTANTLDFATGSLPKLMYQRMDELGIDFTVLYPSMSMGWVHWEDAETRQGLCRAMNMYQMDVWGQFPDRMTPVAMIPMETPDEAIAELEHAVNVMGFKAVMVAGYASRREGPQPIQAGGLVGRPDVFGIDSDFDYDPVWAKCIELGVSPTQHAGGLGFGYRASSLYMYNHIGHFAAPGEALCKALFFGGVTYRFPQLRVAFLEGGVGWACNLYSDLLARWEKRGGHAIDSLDPARMDKELLMKLAEEYEDEKISARLRGSESALRPVPTLTPSAAPRQLDDFAACNLQKAEDVRDRFIPNFFFGCEADDPINAWAFNAEVNPLGARLQAVFGSDISHWDVADMTEPVHEAYELVEKELLTEDDFRDFVFANAVRLYGGMNPDFFKGTRVEAEAARVLKGG